MTPQRPPLRLRVVVGSRVDPLLLAPAIRRRLAGGAWPPGSERQVADAVHAAVEIEHGGTAQVGAVQGDPAQRRAALGRKGPSWR